ncbi:4-hydroxybenzoate octaprenyltransferase [Paenalcaligenes suwonensis]|uniref:4-hydroxybenzoate octaprenyltransferase n=1 Tax=Paenalcaligenes suwonensis TaxID=1202713 RepID=UPI00140DCB04|nr:4-hydroxybenzoate octaprenyltransferase [Paenalcaligenes suwonensis]NHC61577.1 4-hydroxybenzoate octaprenyltransferase [Paenalcaligenes suwonensis]
MSALKTPERIDLNDIRHNDWVARWLPAAWGPYARLCRLDRPVGTWLTLLPTIAALVQAANGVPDWWRLLIFSLGALLMRGVGCCFNDIFDRNFDHQVERTRFRPLTSGQLTLKKALWFVFAQLVVAALFLFAINSYSRWLALALVPIVVIYPLCKRFTYWPQAVLGIAFNWGMLMAWSDTQNIVPLAAIAMWWGTVLWQIGYDAIYGYIDIADDVKLGLKSAAIRFGDNGKQWIGGLYILAMLCWLWAGYSMGMGWGYFVVMAVIAVHFVWQVSRFDPKRPEFGLGLFRANMTVGVLMIVAALAGTI